MTLRLKDKVAVIIGGGSWIGKEIAKQYVLEGAKVFVTGLTESKLQQTVDEIVNAGGEAAYAALDIRNEKQVDELLKDVERRYQKIDILVNSASIYPRTPIEQMTVQEFKDVIDTNLTGAFIALKYAAAIMKKNQKGKVVFISSVVGEEVGVPGLSHYGASKAGMNGLMRTAALELAPFGITVNSIDPGNIVNKERFQITDQHMKDMIKEIPVGRTGQPSDIAYLAVFLGSEESNFVTGQNYVIDGGEVIC